MSERTPFPAEDLIAAGLNRQHVFDLDDLPEAVSAPLGLLAHEKQLILIGHAGRRLWECLQTAALPGPDPIDDYTVATLRGWFAAHAPHRRYRILYPGDTPLGLQTLGRLAGWHTPSPFMLGIDTEWGSWFAYRAVLLADSDFFPSIAEQRSNPCASCADSPCRAACPAQALSGGEFHFARCASYRLLADSACAHGCLARQSCPVGIEHRYDDAQIAHSYRRSLSFLREHFAGGPTPAR